MTTPAIGEHDEARMLTAIDIVRGMFTTAHLQGNLPAAKVIYEEVACLYDDMRFKLKLSSWPRSGRRQVDKPTSNEGDSLAGDPDSGG